MNISFATLLGDDQFPEVNVLAPENQTEALAAIDGDKYQGVVFVDLNNSPKELKEEIKKLEDLLIRDSSLKNALDFILASTFLTGRRYQTIQTHL